MNKTIVQPEQAPAIPPANGFARLLAEQRKGDCLQEASEKLNELILKIRERLRPGEITITDEVSIKLPKEDKEGFVMYTTDRGALTRIDPDQRELILREVKKEEQPLREVAPQSAIKTAAG
jgi:hypothetical protein